jgi:hypothetical protein
MQLLAPLGLLSLLATLLPIAVHLLSRRSGKIVKVGSIQFLVSSTSARFKSLRLSELPLLLVRVALLVLLALLLAQPVWLEKTSSSSFSSTSWVLVAPDLLHPAHRDRVWPLLDSLAAAGYELHLLAAGFPVLSSGDVTTVFHKEQNQWSLLRELEQTLRAPGSVQVIATDRLLAYRGERPKLQRQYAWKTVSTVQPRRWLHAARRFEKAGLRVVIGFSDGVRTRYASCSVALPAQRTIISSEGMPPLEYFPSPPHQREALRLVQNEQDGAEHFHLQPEADSMQIAIVHTPPRKMEAQYLQTALHVAADAIPRKLRVQAALQENVELPWADFDFVFWLVEDSLPAFALQQIERGLVVITTATGPAYEKCVSWMIMPQAGALSFPCLWRRIAEANHGLPVWTDGFGRPVLEAERRGRGWHYRFAGRFDPNWSDMVIHAAFPEWLLALLSREDIVPKNEPPRHDQRRIGVAQSLPQKNENTSAGETRSAIHALHIPLWLLAVLMFGVERWMSDRKST